MSAISSLSSVPRRRQQLGLVHAGDERLAHRIGNFQQNFAVALGLDQPPNRQAIIQRQRFENVRHVGRMQIVELFLQRGLVLLVD